MSKEDKPLHSQRQKINCPTCKKPFEFEKIPASMPFCSERCKMIDLGHWINEEIGLPHVPNEEDEQEQTPPVVREWTFD